MDVSSECWAGHPELPDTLEQLQAWYRTWNVVRSGLWPSEPDIVATARAFGLVEAERAATVMLERRKEWGRQLTAAEWARQVTSANSATVSDECQYKEVRGGDGVESHCTATCNSGPTTACCQGEALAYGVHAYERQHFRGGG